MTRPTAAFLRPSEAGMPPSYACHCEATTLESRAGCDESSLEPLRYFPEFATARSIEKQETERRITSNGRRDEIVIVRPDRVGARSLALLLKASRARRGGIGAGRGRASAAGKRKRCKQQERCKALHV